MGETVCVVELVIPVGVADPSLAGGPFMNHIEHAPECPTEEWEPGHVPADCHSSLFKGCPQKRGFLAPHFWAAYM